MESEDERPNSDQLRKAVSVSRKEYEMAALLIRQSSIATMIGENGPVPDDIDVGSMYKEGKLFFPSVNPSLEDETVFGILNGLSEYFCSDHFRDKYSGVLIELTGAIVNGEFSGFRPLTGNRMEFFIEVPEPQTNGAFVTLLKESELMRWKSKQYMDNSQVQRVIQLIVNYAKRQATLDRRISDDMTMGNFSLIVSIGNVMKQDTHVDLSNEACYQCSIMGTNSSGTTEYKVRTECKVRGKSCDLKTMWNHSGFKFAWDDITTELNQKLWKNNNVRDLLQQFGVVLCPLEPVDEGKKLTKLPVGTLLSMPGGIAHCGPAVSCTSGKDEARMIIFFTATPPGEKPYNSEEQYSATSLIGDIMMFSWLSLHVDEKKYMLRKWKEVGLDNDEFGLDNVVHPNMKVIGYAIQGKNGATLKKLINRISEDTAWYSYTPETWFGLEKANYTVPVSETGSKNSAKKRGRGKQQ